MRIFPAFFVVDSVLCYTLYMQRAESDSELYSTARSPLFSEYLGEKEIFCKTNFACLPGAYVGLINEMKIGQNFLPHCLFKDTAWADESLGRTLFTVFGTYEY